MPVTLKSSDHSVKSILQRAFPEFKGRSVTVDSRETVRFYGTLWDSGSKREYALVCIDSGRVSRIKEAPFLQRSEFHENDHPVIPGVAVAVLSHSGLHEFAYIYFHADDMPKSAQAETTRNEKIVLYATRSLKSSYGGVKNYRFREAHESTGISWDEWISATESLMNRGMLTKRGAITATGRNQVQDIFSFRTIDS